MWRYEIRVPAWNINMGPRDIPHVLGNPGPTEARMTLPCKPGGFETSSNELAKAAADMAGIICVMAKHAPFADNRFALSSVYEAARVGIKGKGAE